MRVLHTSAGNLYGGIERVLATLAGCRALCPGMQPEFALCFEGRLSQELRDTGVLVHILDPARVSRPWTILRARRHLRRLLATMPFDSVMCHACWPHALFAPVVRRARLPLVFWSHDAPRGRHWLERWAARTPPDLVIANSKYTQAALPNLFPGVASEVIYCPVPTPDIGDRAANRRAVRAELGTPADAVVIVIASRLERWKGHTLLVNALARLKGVPGWQCWIIGGTQRPHEERYLAELHGTVTRAQLSTRVQFLGQRHDVPRLLAAADIHCQPNTAPEPFGVAFIEALYAGLPVVTTALGGALEIVDESCGFVVARQDATSLAARLRPLIEHDDERRQLGAASAARARRLSDPGEQLSALQTVLTAQVQAVLA